MDPFGNVGSNPSFSNPMNLSILERERRLDTSIVYTSEITPIIMHLTTKKKCAHMSVLIFLVSSVIRVNEYILRGLRFLISGSSANSANNHNARRSRAAHALLSIRSVGERDTTRDSLPKAVK